MGSSHTIFTTAPFVIEVRVSLLVNERLGWLLPIYFCIGELLTVDEVITKTLDAFWILRNWSYANTRKYLRRAQRANAGDLIQ